MELMEQWEEAKDAHEDDATAAGSKQHSAAAAAAGTDDSSSTESSKVKPYYYVLPAIGTEAKGADAADFVGAPHGGALGHYWLTDGR